MYSNRVETKVSLWRCLQLIVRINPHLSLLSLYHSNFIDSPCNPPFSLTNHRALKYHPPFPSTKDPIFHGFPPYPQLQTVTKFLPIKMMEQAQGLSSKITRELLISVMVVIFVFFLLLLFFYLQAMRYRLSRPSAIIRFVPAADEGLRGLDPALLQSLPITVFRQEDFKEGLECSVCLSELSPGEEARFLPKCGHGFHLRCIDMWFRSNSTCPLCRGPVVSETTTKSGCEQTDPATSQISESNPSTGDATATGSVAAGPSAQKSERMLVVEIPSREMDGLSLTPAAEDTRSPMSARLRSLRRFLSRGSLGIVSPPSAGGGRDIEEGIVGGGGAAAGGTLL